MHWLHEKFWKYLYKFLVQTYYLNSTGTSDINYKLVWCIKCNKTLPYVARNGKLCFQCQTILQYKCGKCAKLYRSNDTLQKHLSRSCNGEKTKFTCDHCQFETYEKTTLAKHIQARHLSLIPNLIDCKKCGKCYSSHSGLRKHSKLCGQAKDDRRSL